jgi:hypothetical protein
MADATPNPHPEPPNWLTYYADRFHSLLDRATDASVEARTKLGEELIVLGGRMISAGAALVNEANRNNDPPSTD